MVTGKELVIIGNSHAGLAALQSIRDVDPKCSITIITREEAEPYSPTSLAAFIAGEIREENLKLKNLSFYSDMNASILFGRQVEDLNPKEKETTLADGAKLGYDQVLVATGSVPIVPPISGLSKKEALTLRTVEDAKRIMELAKSSKKAVIIGAGLIGMEVAMSLRKRGLDVVLVEKEKRVLPLYFDDDAASIIEGIYREQGIKVIKGNQLINVEKGVNAQRLSLESGDRIEADFTLVAVGMRPNVEFILNSGIEIGEGVLVNERLQTSAPSVYAAGDVAQAKGFFGDGRIVTPTVLNAVNQGKVAGSNMVGQAKEFEGSLPMNIFNFFGNVAFSIGISLSEGKDEAVKVLKKIDKENQSFRKLVITDGKLVGCTMINQLVEAGLCQAMIRQGWEVDDVVEHFDNDLASAFRRTVINNSGKEMKRQREEEDR